MKIKTSFFICIVCVLNLACNNDEIELTLDENNIIQKKERLCQEEIGLDSDIYMIVENIADSYGSGQFIQIENDTSMHCEQFMTFFLDSINLTQTEFDNFLLSEKQSYVLDSNRFKPDKHTLISLADIEELYLDEVLEMYGYKGYLYLGPLFFYNNNSCVMFQYRYYCGPICAYEYIAVMQKEDEEWDEIFLQLVGISK